MAYSWHTNESRCAAMAFDHAYSWHTVVCHCAARHFGKALCCNAFGRVVLVKVVVRQQFSARKGARRGMKDTGGRLLGGPVGYLPTLFFPLLLSLSYFVWDMLQVRRETVRVTVLVVSIVPG